MSGWTSAPLGEICEINVGRTPSRNRRDYWGEGAPWLSIADMNQGRNLISTKEQITQLAVAEATGRPAEPGTVLLSFKLSIGKVGIAGVPLFTNEAIAALPIRQPDRILPEFLYWALRALDLTSNSSRAAMGETLNKAKLRLVQVPLPPLNDQRRIVEVMDRADELRAKRREALAHLDELAQSIFLDMFGDPATNGRGWVTSTVGAVAEQVTDGEHQTPKRSDSGIKLLSARNVRDGCLEFGNVDYIQVDEFERIRKRCEPRRGDILISCSGTIGRVAAVDTDEPFALVRSVALVRPVKELLLSRFLEAYLQTPAMKARMLRSAKASSQANLFQGPIRALPVFLPPLELQQEFQARTSAIAEIKAAHHAGLTELDGLFESLQDRAFRGLL
ncbi:restriction endonuclease subunit S [Micromonospora sp. RP3T]|uniref:restriction endonuclease subunit S n=1 Tax=Micromonospora sp. RP3T TaxID=2135446 RepID=UPI000D174D8E|nr:restriction endonuclease subunit S [Micromonospora sp. RP3T]PTA46434.1 restriction endonuclease subunit S [Micromonospora sp. RP3T]